MKMQPKIVAVGPLFEEAGTKYIPVDIRIPHGETRQLIIDVEPAPWLGDPAGEAVEGDCLVKVWRSRLAKAASVPRYAVELYHGRQLVDTKHYEVTP